MTPLEIPSTAPPTLLDWRPSFSKYLGFGGGGGKPFGFIEELTWVEEDESWNRNYS